MKQTLLFLFLLSFFTILFGQKQRTNVDYYFYENKGQIVNQDGKENVAVKYLFHSNGLNVQLRKEGFSYDVYEVEKSLNKRFKNKKKDPFSHTAPQPQYDYKYRYHRVDIDFVSANKNPEIVAEGKSSDYDNYYNVPHKPKGVEKVHRFQKIIYKNLYDKIDLVFFKPEDTLKPIEYNFIVNAGGKISDIQLKLNGAKSQLKDGKVVMTLRFGEMEENIPYSWEQVGNIKNTINVGFKDLGNGIFGFNADKDISDKTVVIDPVPNRMWSSYYGGNSTDYVSEIVTDKLGNVCLTGNTFSTANIATAGGFITSIYRPSNLDSYVMKLDSNGSKLWATYTNGLAADINIDSNNNILATGNVYLLSNIGTPGTHKPNHNNFNHDAYILKLKPDGIREWGTFYGGPFEDNIYASVVDINDNIIIAGYTESASEIASTFAHQPYRNGYTKDGFIAKINSSGQRIWGTYYGGSGEDILKDITVDETSDIYVVGQTSSDDSMIFGTPHKSVKDGPTDAVLARFSSTGDIIFGTYYGGENKEDFDKISYANQKIIISGQSSSSTKLATSNAPFPTSVANLNTINSIFSLFHKNGQLLMGSYFYNTITDSGFDFDGNILISGYTSNDGLGTPNSFQQFRYNHSEDAFLIKYDVNTYSKLWGTYFGGEAVESETVLYVDKILQHIYLGGKTHSSLNISSPNAYQKNKYNTWEDGYIIKFSHCQNNVQVSASAVVCPGSSINLSASGGTSYSWSGPNGFSSTQQNPVIPNATVAHTGTYTCTITGTGDCDGTYSVTVKVEDTIAPIPDIATLPTITGNCTTVISAVPTATDACAGKITATTTSPLNYSQPANYVITWKYDDGHGNISSQTQNVTITREPLPTANSAQTFCKINTPKISDILITGTGIKWYDATGNPLNANTALIDGKKYYATQTVDGCESEKARITVTVTDPNPPTGNVQQDFCSAQNPTISNLVVAGSNISWYDAAGIKLTASTPLSDGKTYYATQTVGGCESTQKLAVKVSVANGGIPAADYSTIFCNDTDSNTKTVNLNDFKTNLIANTSGLTFDFFDSANQSISNPSSQKLIVGANVFNVKISNALGCFVNVKLTLTLNPKPVLNMPQTGEFCSGQTVNLDAGTGFSSYEWSKDNNPTVISTSQIFPVSTAGKYKVKVKNGFGCENSASVTVTQSSLGVITGVQIVNNSASVMMSNPGDFLYSLDKVSWQKANSFTNLSNGNHTAFVKTSGGCVIGQMNFTIFNVPNSFTPNDDGINDTWKIDGMENYPNSDIKVYDRDGKVILSKITNGTFEWDGTFASRPLPSGSYWYVIKVSDGRILKDWLLIKNRN